MYPWAMPQPPLTPLPPPSRLCQAFPSEESPVPWREPAKGLRCRRSGPEAKPSIQLGACLTHTIDRDPRGAATNARPGGYPTGRRSRKYSKGTHSTGWLYPCRGRDIPRAGYGNSAEDWREFKVHRTARITSALPGSTWPQLPFRQPRASVYFAGMVGESQRPAAISSGSSAPAALRSWATGLPPSCSMGAGVRRRGF